jgi:hypothetical protein
MAQSTPTKMPRKKLVVAVTDTPPFVIYNSDSSLAGISVELWRGVARELALEYEFRKVIRKPQFVGSKGIPPTRHWARLRLRRTAKR